MNYWRLFGTLCLTAMVGVACSSGGNPAGGLVDENGDELTSVDSTDPLTVALEGLTANEQYRLVVKGPTGTELSPSGGFIATADEEGKIPASTVLQDLGTTTTSKIKGQGILATRTQGVAGTYTILVNTMDDAEVLELTFTVANGPKVFCTDSTGTARGSFVPSENVWAKISQGDGTVANGTYTCYVVSDGNAVLQDGDTLVGTTKTITVADGTGTVNLGQYGLAAYDVICDIDKDGEFTRGTDLISRARRHHACFTIQNTNSGNDIIGQVCADKNGNYRDVFDPNATDRSIRDVWAWISPAERLTVDHRIGVRKYVVEHKDTWTDGDTLVDVTGAEGASAFELDAVQAFCTNEAPWLIWPRQRLTAGCFDCIVDVNADGKYTKGTDFLDNIDLTAQATCGMRVSNTSCADAITVTSPEDGSETDETTATIDGTLSEAGSSGSITITSGTQSNRVNLAVSSTTIGGTIPLFHGENLITIAVTKSDGTTCSKTIKVTSNAEASASELFRAQLTWATGNDMDLHVIKPGGTVGSSTDDCNYSTCKVAVGGLDWTDEGHSYLDVDCIPSLGCTNFIENVWVNDINQSGLYKIYVDAFSSSTATGVRGTIFILGNQVSVVECGSLAGGTATDWCYVGDLQWSGSSTGAGAFTPKGTTSATP